MISKNICGVFLLVLLLLFSGCGGEIAADLYIQDIYEAAETVENELWTTATIALETYSDEHREEFSELISSIFSKAGHFRIQSRGFSDYFVADVRIPLLAYENREELRIKDGLLGAVALGPDEDGDYFFGLALNSAKFEDISQQISSEYWTDLSFEKFSLQLNVINDTRESVDLTVQGVYANQKPVLYDGVFKLERRDSLEIKLSDLMRDWVYENGTVLFGYL
ncbi:MAG: hypothetical protein GX335_10075 [Firmicutes bacterium]|nr:hypothetical protein [Bacillota bacterium]